MSADSGEVERTLMVNVGSVGDLRRALYELSPSCPVRVEAPLLDGRLVIDEVTVSDDGHLVIYVGPK